MKIYISGRVTGLFWDDAKAKFEDAKARAQKVFPQHEIVIPFDLNMKPGTPWADAMDTCIDTLYKCGAIIMLDGWEQSNGARVEHKIAEHMGIIVFDEKAIHSGAIHDETDVFEKGGAE